MKIIILISLFCFFILPTYARPYISVSRPYVPAKHFETQETSASDMLPLEYLTDNFDMFVPMEENYQVAATMNLQNFDSFKEMTNANAEMMMEENYLLPRKTPLRRPQSLSAKEKHIRNKLEDVNAERERKKIKYFHQGGIGSQKGAGVIRSTDSISGHPGVDQRYIRG